MAKAKKKRYRTATMTDSYVKMISPTTAPFTQFWRVVADLHNGKTDVFWGYANPAKQARAKKR